MNRDEHGSLNPDRGSVRVQREVSGEVITEELLVKMWDAAPPCALTRCPVYGMCEHPKIGRCGLQRQYVSSITDVVIGKKLLVTQEQMLRFGMHLAPLYKMLCRFQMEEVALESVLSMTEKGNTIVHPLFREIRETLKTIDGIWAKMGFDGHAPKGELPLRPHRGRTAATGARGNIVEAEFKAAQSRRANRLVQRVPSAGGSARGVESE